MKNSRFFTSIELVVVLGIISLLLGLTTVYYFNFKTATALKLAAHEAAATLNQARSLAITKQEEHSVLFDLANNQYEIQDSAALRVDEEHRLGEGIIIDLCNFDSNSATYSPTGTVEGKRVILKDNKNEYYTIKVLNETGRVKILNYRELPSG
ncbi:MAG: hypothetical protein KAS13_00645 [Candidatus Omnitrophica bacterium]|nr:hypothetical protein [Candidatus Omnitrophota bacterium]